MFGYSKCLELLLQELTLLLTSNNFLDLVLVMKMNNKIKITPLPNRKLKHRDKLRSKLDSKLNKKELRRRDDMMRKKENKNNRNKKN
jgi:hypothetical protein